MCIYIYIYTCIIIERFIHKQLVTNTTIIKTTILIVSDNHKRNNNNNNDDNHSNNREAELGRARRLESTLVGGLRLEAV